MKKIATFALSIIIALGSQIIPSSHAAHLTDIDGHPYQTAIEQLELLKIIEGHPDNTYRPETGVNRAEVLTLLFRASEDRMEKTQEQCFPDVPRGIWYEDAVCSGKTLGHLIGYPDGMYHAEREVNKAEAMKLVGEFMKWDTGAGLDPLFDPAPDFPWFEWYVMYAERFKLIDSRAQLGDMTESMPRGLLAEIIYRSIVLETFDSLNKRQYGEELSDQYLQRDKSASMHVIDVEYLTGTRDEAIQATLRKLDVGRTTDEAIAYLDYKPNRIGNEVLVFDGYKEKYEKHLLEKDMWLVWVNYQSNERFGHRTELLGITKNGVELALASDLWPAVNGVEKWSTAGMLQNDQRIIFRGANAKQALQNPLPPFPDFGTCNANTTEKKVALILYLGEGRGVKQDAINMYDTLCGMNYMTTHLTGDNLDRLKDDFTTALDAIATPSRVIANNTDNSLRSFVFYTVAEATTADGDLIVDIRRDTLEAEVLELEWLTQQMGSIAYNIGGATGLWSDSFTIIQDSSLSGKVIPLHQSASYVPNVREGAIGWVATSTDDLHTNYSRTDHNGTSNYTNGLISCLASTSPHGTLKDCLEAAEPNQNPQLERLNILTDPTTPFTQ